MHGPRVSGRTSRRPASRVAYRPFHGERTAAAAFYAGEMLATGQRRGFRAYGRKGTNCGLLRVPFTARPGPPSARRGVLTSGSLTRTEVALTRRDSGRIPLAA